MSYRRPLLLIASLAALTLISGTVTYAIATDWPRGQAAEATPGPANWRLEMRFALDKVTEFEAGQIIRIDLGGRALGVFASTAPGASITLEVSGDPHLSVSGGTVVDDGRQHQLRLDLLATSTGTAYELAVDGKPVLSGAAAGVLFSRPALVVVSPYGDLESSAEVTVTTLSVSASPILL